jgi:hypothetical protein
MSENSRFKVVETPAMMPGECWITKTSVGPFIDTGTDVPFERRGRVYISLDVLREMAFEAGLFEGLVPKTYVDEAHAQGYADAIKENINGDLAGAAAALRSAADRVDAVLAGAEAPVAGARARR